MNFEERISWVTGAGGGIGRETTLHLARLGSKLVISDKNEESLANLIGELEEMDAQFISFCLDVSDRTAVQQVSKQIEEKYGRLDVLVNGAGISPKGKGGRTTVEELNASEWLKVIDVNLNGTFHCCQAAIPLMKKNKSGQIVNIASLAGKAYSQITGSHYAASKAGMIALTRQLAGELGSDGIRVNAVAPGRIDTPMIYDVEEAVNQRSIDKTPLKRLGTSKEVATTILFLVSELSSFITGSTIDVNGGMIMH